MMHYIRVLAVCVVLLAPLLQGQDEEGEQDPGWYMGEELPEVDLEGLIANLTQEISWFKYVGNVTLDCAAKAHEMSTLMEAVETLHDCLEAAYQHCASFYADQNDTCYANNTFVDIEEPCATLRLGVYLGDNNPGWFKMTPKKNNFRYPDGSHCWWNIRVPEPMNFTMNLTVDQFDMEVSENCEWDYVYFYDYNETVEIGEREGLQPSRRFGKFCGRIPRFTIYGQSAIMSAEAVTDYSISKYGFRAIYQVMDIGKGETFNLTRPYFNDSQLTGGSFDLTQIPFQYYDFYYDTLYYAEWQIGTLYDHYLKFNYTVEVSKGTNITIHDGTSQKGNILALHNESDPIGTFEKSANSHGLLLVLRDNDGPSVGVATLSLTYESKKRDYTQLTHDAACDPNSHQIELGASAIGDNGTARSITITSELVENANIHCEWAISIDPTLEGDYYINMTFEDKFTNFQGFNTYGCLHEGMVIVDGIDLNEPKSRHFGPVCYDDPEAFYNFVGKFGLVSTDKAMYLVFYSLIGFGGTPWDASELQLKLRLTECRGFWNPCPSASRGFLPPPPSEHYTYTAENNGDEINVNFTCEKSKCCQITQMPSYDHMTYKLCTINIGREGNKILATSAFVTAYVPSQKHLESLEYSCERPERIALQHNNEDMLECLGTKTFYKYRSESPWSLGNFAARIQEEKCGQYEPDLHLENVFYPPCANAYLPVRPDNFTMKYIAHAHVAGHSYQFTFSYKGTCPMSIKQCLKQQIEIRDKYTSYIWKDRTLPFKWYTWPENEPGQNWTREVTVTRYLNNENVSCNATTSEQLLCQIHVDFQSNNRRIANADKHQKVECPEGFDHVGTTCYKLVWPGSTPETIMGSQDGLTSQNAEKRCQLSGGHLAGIQEPYHLELIRKKIYHEWWHSFLSKMPGIKIFHIGMNDISRHGHYQTRRKKLASFGNWLPPNIDKGYMPDATRNAKDEIVDSVQNDFLKIAMKRYQPSPDAASRCTVMTLYTPHLESFRAVDQPLPWYKVPCDEKIVGSVALCEATAVKGASELEDMIMKENFASPDLNKTFYERLFHPDYSTTVNTVGDRHMLSIAKHYCPPGMNLVNRKCLAISISHTCSLKVPNYNKRYNDDTSPLFKAAEAKLSPYDIPFLYRMLRTWHITPTTLPRGESKKSTSKYHIRFSFASNKSTGYKAACLVPGALANKVDKPEMYWNMQWQFYPDCESNRESSGVDFLTLCSHKQFKYEDKCQANQHRCDDGTCILQHHRCDGSWECLDGSDEKECGHSCEPIKGAKTREMRTNADCQRYCFPHNCTCSSLYFQCSGGGCIPISKICDSQQDCHDNSDEQICSGSTEVKCVGEGKFECSSGFCIKSSFRCNYRRDCPDGSDERECPCNTDIADGGNFYRCPEGSKYLNDQCLYKSFKMDSFPDCSDEEIIDEDVNQYNTYENNWQADKVRSYNAPIKGIMDKCFKEKSDTKAPCSNNMVPHSCFVTNQVCVLEINPAGHFEGCRSGTHLQRCEAFQCPSMFKCPGTFCINTTQVCDGVSDCPNGDDEAKCTNFFCPGMYRCRGENRCIWQEQVCDGIYDCPLSHDDELLCGSLEYKCPDNCICLGQAIDCSRKNMSEEAINKIFGSSDDKIQDSKVELKINPKMRAVLLAENRLAVFPPSIPYLKEMYRLNLSYNSIGSVSNDLFNPALRELYLHGNEIASFGVSPFDKLSNLIVLTLHNNKITTISGSHFVGLEKLPILDLSNQLIDDSITSKAFKGLHSAHTINISNNDIDKLKEKAFLNAKGDPEKDEPFTNLRYFDISGNTLEDIDPKVFEDLGSTVALFTDRYKWCCFAVNVRRCEPQPDEFSSCTHLIASRTMHLFIWGMGILSFLGNLIILQQRIKHERETTVSVMVQHLAFSDMLMGAYLLMIAGADTWYKNVFIFNTDAWRNHPVCKVAGFLYQTSAEMSLLILVILVCDRMYSMLPGCNAHGMSLKSARGFAALGWTASAVVGILPYLEFEYFKDANKAETAICIMFNLTYGKRIKPWEYFICIYILYNLFCVVLMGTGYSLIGKWIRRGLEVWNDMLTEDMTDEEKEAELQYRRNEVIISKRLFLVVATNVVIWLPVIMITAFAMLDVYIDPTTSAWVTIFVVPLNSVLNPFLFSFVVHPYRSKKDQLLLNWVETEMDDEEDEFGGLGEGETTAAKADDTTDGGESSMATASAALSTTVGGAKSYNKGIIGEML